MRPDTFRRALDPATRMLVAAGTLGWLISSVWFWQWWLRPEDRTEIWATATVSLLLGYLALQPMIFLMAANRLREVDPARPVPELRVAFVVTKAPSEPWDVARKTLEAMLVQRYPFPYDVWLCDEAPDDGTVRWCTAHGIGISTRRDQPAYHQPHWPRRTRCKEGNLAWFYDTFGYRCYDVVAQLDCDHVPGPRYLAEIVRPFADPAVGYVAAPSVCDADAADSWSARGRLDREAAFHGPVQTSHNGGTAPTCIGSHYAVRTAALRQIGGLGPELAEDFSTTFLLSSAGWQGAFAQRARAHGDGPLTFAAMATQEFQWSRSMIVLLLGLAPRHLPRLPWRLRLRFLHTLSFYPAQALLVPAGLTLTAAASVGGFSWVNVHYPEFLLRWAVPMVWLVAVAWLLRHRGLMRPADAPLLSWEGSLYVLTRWVWITSGAVAAVRQMLTGHRVTFAVTPKTRTGLDRFGVRLIRPYLVVSALMTAAAGVGHLRPGGAASGYVALCVLPAMTYALTAVLVPLLHAWEGARATGVRWGTAIRLTCPAALPLALLCLLGVTAVAVVCRAELLTLLH